MVDKARGKIILFESGQPVFAGPALTGESTADQMPKTELGEKFDTLNAPNTKITPAGRYTVERGFDPEVGGPLFDIHEIRGKDWGIASISSIWEFHPSIETRASYRPVKRTNTLLSAVSTSNGNAAPADA